MYFAVEIILEMFDADVSWNAVKTASRHNVDTFFLGQIIVFQLHRFHVEWLTAHVNMMRPGVYAAKEIHFYRTSVTYIHDSNV